MKRLITTTFSCLFLLLLTGIVASADNPHFQYANSSFSGNTLCVNFKEVGLGNTATSADITLTATRSATFGCVNHGSHEPSGLRRFVSQPSTTQSFPIRNGSTSGNICLGPPTAQEVGFTCPDGMRVVLVSVCFTNASISGAGATEPVSGSFGNCP